MSSETAFLTQMRTATVSSGISLAYATAGPAASSRSILLVHGYPQTAFSMRHVAKALAEKGFYVVAVDYRGAGGSSMPPDGYSKMTMASDLHSLMTKKLHRQRYIVLGHDIGSMVVTAQALTFRDNVEALIMMGAILAGRWSSTRLLFLQPVQNVLSQAQKPTLVSSRIAI